MAQVALALSLLIAVLGAVGIFSPQRFVGTLRRFQSPTGLYVAAAIRLLLGAALLVSAPDSRAPEALLVLGVAIVVAGLVTPWLPLERLRAVLDRWVARGPGFLRAWAAFALVFGLCLAYAVGL